MRCPGGWLLVAGLGLLGCRGDGDPVQPLKLLRDPTQPTSLPLHIEGMYITQGSQRLDRSVPLVQGKDGCLRVFVLARTWNAAAPPVRVRVLDPDGLALLDWTIPGPDSGVPRAIREADLARSWNMALEGGLIQPGNRFQAEVIGPAPEVESGELSYPADGSALPMNVVAAAPLRLTLVPIHTQGKTGVATAAGRTLDSWVQNLIQVFPLGRVAVRVAGDYVTDLDPHDDVQQAKLLDRLEAMRLAGGDDDRYFYGVYPARTGRNKSGLGYVPVHPGPAYRTAIGWDGFNYAQSLTHELGHNLGLHHAPCAPGDQHLKGVDPGFPYPGGGIGACGFEVRTGTPKDPEVYKDVMSYCTPAWSSDYDCKAILAFRAGEPEGPAHSLGAAAQEGLLVRGFIRPGRADLEPAFQVRRAPLLPSPGEYLLTALDARGHTLASVPFAPAAIEDLAEDPDLDGFAFVIPMTRAMEDSLATLRVSLHGANLGERHAPGRSVRGEAFEPHAARDGHRLVRLRWDAQACPEVIVKDAGSGEVLSMGADGHLTLDTRAHELECLFSDGLRTLVRKVAVQ